MGAASLLARAASVSEHSDGRMLLESGGRVSTVHSKRQSERARSTDVPRRVVIVGAGPAGLAAATELLEREFAVTILEQDERYVGGIARTVRYNGFRFDIGGHRFFTKNHEIEQWWHDRLPGDFLAVNRQTRILYRRRLFDYPLRPGNALRNLGLLTSAACVLSYARSRLFPIRPELTFEDWVCNRFGRRLFNIFFKTYTEKVWGMKCREISADWAAQRIRGLSLTDAILNAFRGQKRGQPVIKTLIDQFQYPRLGSGMLWEKTRDDLVRSGAQVLMGKKVEQIHHSGERVLQVQTVTRTGERETWSADDFIFSMPLRDCALGLRPRISTAVEAAARGLRYRDFLIVALIVKGEQLFPDNWIYVHDPGVRVGRVDNFNNWSPDMVPQPGMTCLGLEYFCNADEPLWKAADEDLIALAKSEAGKIDLIDPGSVVDGCVVRMEKAYPVYDTTYQTHVATIRAALSGLKNIQMVGRNGMHKYNNQDHAMLTGIVAARNLKGIPCDPWRVNSDAEYLEAGQVDDAGRLVPQAAVAGTRQLTHHG